MNWAIIIYEADRHSALPNSFGRYGVHCVIPMVQEWSEKARKKILRPALHKLMFMEADEAKVCFVKERVRYVEDVWRDGQGNLCVISDEEFQAFLDRLDKREKKAAKRPSALNLADATELDFFNIWVTRFGLPMAIKRFGRDLRVPEAA